LKYLTYGGDRFRQATGNFAPAIRNAGTTIEGQWAVTRLQSLSYVETFSGIGKPPVVEGLSLMKK
jgi:hypothetical protein